MIQRQRQSTVILLILVIFVAHGWEWIPQAEHPCNIRRLTMEDLFAEFGSQGLPPLYPEPVVIRPDNAARNAALRAVTTRETLLEQFEPGFNVTLSSSNALSERRRTITLQQYLQEMEAVPETTPRQLSNESWYLFGETYTAPWQSLLQSYELPPCQTCVCELSALSFGIGNRGSGVQWHTHGPGFSEALHGRKHWILYPAHKRPPNIHKDQSSRQWMEIEYPRAAGDDDFYECTRKRKPRFVTMRARLGEHVSNEPLHLRDFWLQLILAT